MTNDVRPVPTGYHSVTPYLIVDGAVEAIEFHGKVFGARERMRMPGPDGKIGHAEVEIGDSCVMLADEYPDMGARGPRTIGGSPVFLHVYVDDVDAVMSRALEAGAKQVRPIEDQFYGDRAGSFEDPFGHVWHVATRTEEIPLDELKRRAAEKASEHG